MITHEINIKHNKDDGVTAYHVTVDGKELEGVHSATVEYQAAYVPTVTLEVMPSKTDIDALAKLEVALDINDVREAIYCLQLEMKLNNDFKKSVYESAKSVLTESGITDPIADNLVDMLIDRIFFGELP